MTATITKIATSAKKAISNGCNDHSGRNSNENCYKVENYDGYNDHNSRKNHNSHNGYNG